jgi:hypothetical protein
VLPISLYSFGRAHRPIPQSRIRCSSQLRHPTPLCNISHTLSRELYRNEVPQTCVDRIRCFGLSVEPALTHITHEHVLHTSGTSHTYTLLLNVHPQHATHQLIDSSHTPTPTPSCPTSQLLPDRDSHIVNPSTTDGEAGEPPCVHDAPKSHIPHSQPQHELNDDTRCRVLPLLSLFCRKGYARGTNVCCRHTPYTRRALHMHVG